MLSQINDILNADKHNYVKFLGVAHSGFSSEPMRHQQHPLPPGTVRVEVMGAHTGYGRMQYQGDTLEEAMQVAYDDFVARTKTTTSTPPLDSDSVESPKRSKRSKKNKATPN